MVSTLMTAEIVIIVVVMIIQSKEIYIEMNDNS